MKTLVTLFIFSWMSLCAFSQVKKGSNAPEISLQDLEGRPVSLSGLKGKVVLIDFWASWCGPCRNNNPRLAQLYQKYHEKGLEMLGVSVDNNPTYWKQAVMQDGLEWLQVNDNRGWESSVALAYNVNAIPASFLIDKDGVVRGIDLEGRALHRRHRQLAGEPVGGPRRLCRWGARRCGAP